MNGVNDKYTDIKCRRVWKDRKWAILALRAYHWRLNRVTLGSLQLWALVPFAALLIVFNSVACASSARSRGTASSINSKCWWKVGCARKNCEAYARRWMAFLKVVKKKVWKVEKKCYELHGVGTAISERIIALAKGTVLYLLFCKGNNGPESPLHQLNQAEAWTWTRSLLSRLSLCKEFQCEYCKSP